MSKFVSIIMTHYAMNDERSDTMVSSIVSLIENTKYPYELIVVDNGGSEADSDFLLELSNKGKITTYVKNECNMHFGYARNQGLALSQGEYICIVDNDLLYTKGWLEECVQILEDFPEEKWYATPIDYPMPAQKKKYRTKTFKHKDKDYTLSMRAGSNCFVMKRDKFFEIGKFLMHRVAGSKWTDLAVKKGYLAVVVGGEMVLDLGLRKGYQFKISIPICINIKNGDRLYLNVDEFEHERKDKI